MREQCPSCGTDLEIMPGVGEYCPNEDCPILDGPFDGSVPKAVIRAPAEPMAFVSEEWPASACASATARVTYAPGLEVDVMLKAGATVEEKSLALAELMGWDVHIPHNEHYECVFDEDSGSWVNLNPYELKAQFAAILLEFRGVMVNVVNSYTGDGEHNGPTLHSVNGKMYEPTQATILDEILRMNGKME